MTLHESMIQDTTLRCIGCGDERPAEEFPTLPQLGLRGERCNACRPSAVATINEAARRATEWNAAHPERVHLRLSRRRREQQDLRLQVIERLGGFCLCCREMGAAFLQVDHLERDGAQHRKALNGNYRRIYRDILADANPGKRFRLLCANCHFAESYRGGCPHRLARPTEMA